MSSNPNIDWTHITVAVVAVAGLILSVYNRFESWKEKRRHLTVKISNGFLTYSRGELSPLLLIVTIRNPGNRAVTINTPHLTLPSNNSISLMEGQVRCPYELEDGKECLFWVEMSSLKTTLIDHGYKKTVKIKAQLQDGAGKYYYSNKPWKLNLLQ
jgi:hypothetical protein